MKFVMFAGMALVVLALLASWTWRFSGSNQWELVGDKRGVKIYSMKTPGLDSKKFKCVFRVRSSMAGLVKLMRDPDACDDMGCTESRLIERVDDQLMYHTFQYTLPSPFVPREFVIRSQVHQKADSKEVLVVFAATPDRLPLNDCCLRVTEFNNSWRLTPLGDGQVDVEYMVDMNEGGFMPPLLLNSQRPKIMFMVLPNIQRILDKEKYQTARLSYIQEK